VRRRTLPAAVRTSYDTAKRSFDRGEYAMAIAGFTTVLTILEDKALSAESGIGDLKQLAEGFSRLAGAELERSEAAAKAAAVPAAPPAAVIAAPAAGSVIYSVRTPRCRRRSSSSDGCRPGIRLRRWRGWSGGRC
jgi:hypothetical protein